MFTMMLVASKLSVSLSFAAGSAKVVKVQSWFTPNRARTRGKARVELDRAWICACRVTAVRCDFPVDWSALSGLDGLRLGV